MGYNIRLMYELVSYLNVDKKHTWFASVFGLSKTKGARIYYEVLTHDAH